MIIIDIVSHVCNPMILINLKFMIIRI